MNSVVASTSYALGAAAFTLLLVLMLTAWRGRLEGGLLVAATALTAIWCVATALYAWRGVPPFSALQLLEIMRDVAWFLFLLKHLGWTRRTTERSSTAVHLLGLGALGLAFSLVVVTLVNRYADLRAVTSLAAYVVVLGHLLLSVVGFVLVEQIYRNTRLDQRWSVEFLCYGVGGMFIYDFYMYADALMFKQVDGSLWAARGIANMLVVPMVAVSAARNPRWTLDVFVSRYIVFHTAALLGAGVYLLIMAAVGYYIRVYGGTWGHVAQVVFFFGALLLLLLLIQSGQLRSRTRVFLGKHFFKNKYDYREEWLRFTLALSAASDHGEWLKPTIIRAIADIPGSPGGVLWERQEEGGFQPVSAHGVEPRVVQGYVEADASLVRFLRDSGWVIFLDEYAEHPDRYEGLELPQWLNILPDAWVIVPLVQGDELVAFVVLRRGQSVSGLDWEDSDLLKTAGRQAASYLVLWHTTVELSDARQFEAFNRLSAYVVHDLKNVVAQLSLVVANAHKHRDAPGFVDDAFATIDNATQKMSRMLGQLRKGRTEVGRVRTIVLEDLLDQVVAARSNQLPKPVLDAELDSVQVLAQPDRLMSAMEHLIQNAQEATPDDGQVTVRARSQDGWAFVEVEDDGCGMDADFVANRLFRPFYTTKGNAGMGVGVYESREFITAIGGSLSVDSEPKHGTVFRVRLPVLTAESALAASF